MMFEVKIRDRKIERNVTNIISYDKNIKTKWNKKVNIFSTKISKQFWLIRHSIGQDTESPVSYWISSC